MTKLGKRLVIDKQEGGCWLLNYNGEYVTVGLGRRNVMLHRFAFALTHGEVPEGFDVMHTCDNPACVNPEHLRLGTRAENMQDCRGKGRLVNGRQKNKNLIPVPVEALHPRLREIYDATNNS